MTTFAKPETIETSFKYGNIGQLMEMLTYMRPAGSPTEAEFIAKFVMPPSLMGYDTYGNLWRTIPNADGSKSPVLWSCHTDTVHMQEGRQSIATEDNGYVFLSDNETKASCLGADDTAGVWLMLQMIEAKVPGTYCFHRAEEVGGIGSRHVALKEPDRLAGLRFAIALDRKGRTSVITHQGGRTCSDAFATSLAAQLSDLTGFENTWEKDNTGLFTDTANYTDLIGECTNLSVGYEHAHSSSEYLDFWFLQDLLECLVGLDQSTLVEARKPGEQDPDDWSYDWKTDYKYSAKEYRFIDDVAGMTDATERGGQRLRDLCLDHPEIVAEVLDSYGITADDILEEIASRSGR